MVCLIHSFPYPASIYVFKTGSAHCNPFVTNVIEMRNFIKLKICQYVFSASILLVWMIL